MRAELREVHELVAHLGAENASRRLDALQAVPAVKKKRKPRTKAK